MIRLILSTASSVCSVEKTMWPVSAACSAVPMVSRIAHFADQNDIGVLTQRGAQGGAWNDGVSTSISRWFTYPFFVAMQEFDGDLRW